MPNVAIVIRSRVKSGLKLPPAPGLARRNMKKKGGSFNGWLQRIRLLSRRIYRMSSGPCMKIFEKPASRSILLPNII
jgi:hypothetical protein